MDERKGECSMEIPSRHRKKRPFRLKRWQWILLIIFIILGSGAVYAYIKINSALDQITSNSEPKTDEEKNAPPVQEPYTEEPFAIVLLGKDSRQNLGLLNTDVMIVGIVSPKEKKVKLVSIPRDTRVMIPDIGYAKVNAAYAYGEAQRVKAERNHEPVTMTGIRMVKKTLEGFLGIPIKHYVTVDFEGFRQVIDELGGVEVNVERRLVYHDPTDGTSIDLKPGLQILDGQKALDYVRHRHDDRGTKYYSSDFERNERERLIIKLVADKMKSFTGITHLFNILDIAGSHITTDLSKEQIIGLFNTFAPIGSSAIETIETKPYWDGYSYTMFSEEEITKLRETLWTAMGMTEEEGLALIDPANDEPPVKKVVKKTTKQIEIGKNDTSKESKADNPVRNETPSKETTQPKDGHNNPPPADEGQGANTGDQTPSGQTPSDQTPSDQTPTEPITPSPDNPATDTGEGLPPGNTATPGGGQ